jgi:exodeoxyribonuclease-5
VRPARTRFDLNRMIRTRRGMTSAWPEVGERLVCLRNQQRELDLLNGTIRIVRDITTGIGAITRQPRVEVRLEPEEGGDWARFAAPAQEYFDHFDFGYALTVHKAQGSEWRSVMVVDESFCWRRENQHHQWLYPAITRASERVCVARLVGWRR